MAGCGMATRLLATQGLHHLIFPLPFLAKNQIQEQVAGRAPYLGLDPERCWGLKRRSRLEVSAPACQLMPQPRILKDVHVHELHFCIHQLGACFGGTEGV